jgi:nucleoid DNA-binding protein
MTKRDLVDKIHANTGLTKDEAFAYLETVLETIKMTLETAETVKISGFRSFVVKKKNSQGPESPYRRAINDHRQKGPDLQAEHPTPPGYQQVNEREK